MTPQEDELFWARVLASEEKTTQYYHAPRSEIYKPKQEFQPRAEHATENKKHQFDNKNQIEPREKESRQKKAREIVPYQNESNRNKPHTVIKRLNQFEKKFHLSEIQNEPREKESHQKKDCEKLPHQNESNRDEPHMAVRRLNPFENKFQPTEIQNGPRQKESRQKKAHEKKSHQNESNRNNPHLVVRKLNQFENKFQPTEISQSSNQKKQEIGNEDDTDSSTVVDAPSILSSQHATPSYDADTITDLDTFLDDGSIETLSVLRRQVDAFLDMAQACRCFDDDKDSFDDNSSIYYGGHYDNRLASAARSKMRYLEKNFSQNYDTYFNQKNNDSTGHDETSNATSRISYSEQSETKSSNNDNTTNTNQNPTFLRITKSEDIEKQQQQQQQHGAEDAENKVNNSRRNRSSLLPIRTPRSENVQHRDEKAKTENKVDETHRIFSVLPVKSAKTEELLQDHHEDQVNDKRVEKAYQNPSLPIETDEELQYHSDDDQHSYKVQFTFEPEHQCYHRCVNVLRCRGKGSTRIAFTILLLGIILILIVVIIILQTGTTFSGMRDAFSRRDDSATTIGSRNRTTNSPTAAPTTPSNYELVTSILEPSFSPGYSSDYWNNPTSPQARALQWIAHEDEVTTNLLVVDDGEDTTGTIRRSIRSTMQPTTSDIKTILERYILAVFYFATSGSSWINNLSFLSKSTSVCNWRWGSIHMGVYCKKDDSITDIIIGKNGLHGTIPSEIAKLSNLQVLALFENSHLGGTLPTELGELSSTLRFLSFSDNMIAGTIPTEYGNLNTLEYALLQRNQLKGSLPSQLGSGGSTSSNTNSLGWSSIKILDVGWNLLTGTIPTEFGNINKGLMYLDLQENLFTGQIPSQLGLLGDLEKLLLEENFLSGTLPAELSKLKKLQRLFLNDNEFLGNVPVSYMSFAQSAHHDLSSLQLHSNLLTGSIDEIFCNSNDTLITDLGTLSADCGGKKPKMICSCCTLCY